MSSYSTPFLLSTKGSTRATAYNVGNKCVMAEGKLHVVWLDAVAEVRGRTFDLATEEWSETYHLFTGCDNHTNPALSMDAHGHLHLVYGPHGTWGKWNNGKFKYAISTRPHRLDTLKHHESFGYDATYASLVYMPQGGCAVTYRGGEIPASLMFQKQRPEGGWNSAQALLGQAIAPQYTHYTGTLCAAKSGTLYASCNFYNVGGGDNDPVRGDQSRMKSHGIAAIKSLDKGETWCDLQGRPCKTPGVWEERIAVTQTLVNPRGGGMAVDSRERLWVGVVPKDRSDRRFLLCCYSDGAWREVDLQPCIPGGYVVTGAMLTVDTRDRVHLALDALPITTPRTELGWAHPRTEVFHMVTDGTTAGTVCRQVSRSDDQKPNWLSSISLGGVFHKVEEPVILYTHGVRGNGCSPTDENDVYCVRVRSAE